MTDELIVRGKDFIIWLFCVIDLRISSQYTDI